MNYLGTVLDSGTVPCSGATPGAGKYDDTDAGWTYAGTWVSYTATGPYNGTERYSTVLNSTATFSFTGTGFVFYYSADKNRGSMQIRVDGNLIATLNEYNSAHLYQRTYSSPSFASGSHTVQFKFVGPSGTYGTLDALQITGSSDTTAPSAIGDLAARTSTTTNGAVNLSWTAPGNDGTVGTATSYLVRYSTSAINSEGAWSSATIVTTGIPTPAASGTAQSMSVSGLTSGTTYYFAVRAQDAVPNLGDLSNSPSAVASTITSPGAGKYDDTDAGWTYGGTWVTYSATGPYNGTERYSTVLNSTATFSFTGTGFVFYYSADKNRGSMQIRVDGNLIATLNEYNSAHIYQRTYSSPSFASGSHTVEFKFVGPSGTYGTLDAITIRP